MKTAGEKLVKGTNLEYVPFQTCQKNCNIVDPQLMFVLSTPQIRQAGNSKFLKNPRNTGGGGWNPLPDWLLFAFAAWKSFTYPDFLLRKPL